MRARIAIHFIIKPTTSFAFFFRDSEEKSKKTTQIICETLSGHNSRFRERFSESRWTLTLRRLSGFAFYSVLFFSTFICRRNFYFRRHVHSPRETLFIPRARNYHNTCYVFFFFFVSLIFHFLSDCIYSPKETTRIFNSNLSSHLPAGPSWKNVRNVHALVRERKKKRTFRTPVKNDRYVTRHSKINSYNPLIRSSRIQPEI